MKNNQISHSEVESLQLLNKFLVDNPELEELSAKLSIFNILKVLKIENTEIRHSNVLAWLLNPQESHGIGQAFIRRFLSTILLDNESSEIKLTPASVELMNLADVEIAREWKNIDLLTISSDNKWVLLIENKIKSSASKRQLDKYSQIVKNEFPKYTIIPVLLTLEIDDGLDAVEDTGYISWSHAQLYNVLSQVFRQRIDRIPEDARIFIEHYLTVLRRLTMQDKEIAQLCKTIYKKHQEAIDLIVEYGATNKFSDAVEEFMAENNDLVKLNTRPRILWFVHKNWEKTMPSCSDRWKHLSKPYPVVCWYRFSTQSSKVGLIIEVGSMEDSKKRLKLINAFKNEGFKIGKMAFRPEAKYTRVHSIYRKVGDPDDQEEIKKHIVEIWKKSNQEFDSTTKIIESFKW
jgi:hypothetical protein